MSDSILYLAIVAIWAGFLIPAWVRRPSFDAEPAAGELAAEQPAEQAEVDFEADVQIEADTENPEYRYDVHMHSYGTAGTRPRGEPPSQSREQMMRARRRMLTILASLVFITAAFVLTGLVQWWICVPPIALLVLYVLLLREIAMADAELARKRAAWEASRARDIWRRSHQVWAETAPASAPTSTPVSASEPTAKIIDISSRVGDQLYDQYADAAVRAVGD